MRVLAGRYALEDELGRGGMGVVHRATDQELGRAVAVKLLPEQFSRQPDFLARFKREAKVAAGLSHPQVAVVHDISQDGEMPYLVMELVAGRTLSSIAGEGPMDPAFVASIAIDVLDALEYCHSMGVVHRDIKPSNIMIDTSGPRPRVKVMDFGIARLLSDTVTRLTATGMLIGTPVYLSPEQAEGKPAGPASDQYSLGCVLYELLTGRPPFMGDSPTVVLLGHIQRTPEVPSTVRPGISPEWDRIIMTALAKAPEDRFADATAMRAALQALLVPSSGWRQPQSLADLMPPMPLLQPAAVPGYGPGAPFRPPGPPGAAAGTWTIMAGIATAFALAAVATFTMGGGLATPPILLAYVVLIGLSATMMVPSLRHHMGAALAGTLPTWPFWIILESDYGSPLLIVSSVCSLVMAAIGAAVALGGGLAWSPQRLVGAICGTVAGLALAYATMDAHGIQSYFALSVGALNASMIALTCLNIPVLAMSAFLRSPGAVASAAGGWMAAVPLYTYVVLG